jgi:hypothetical protein
MTSESKVCFLLRSDLCHLNEDTAKRPLAKILEGKSKQASPKSRPSPLPYLLQERPHPRPRKQCSQSLNEEEEHNEKSTTKKRPKDGQKQKKKEEILKEL